MLLTLLLLSEMKLGEKKKNGENSYFFVKDPNLTIAERVMGESKFMSLITQICRPVGKTVSILCGCIHVCV